MSDEPKSDSYDLCSHVCSCHGVVRNLVRQVDILETRLYPVCRPHDGVEETFGFPSSRCTLESNFLELLGSLWAANAGLRRLCTVLQLQPVTNRGEPEPSTPTAVALGRIYPERRDPDSPSPDPLEAFNAATHVLVAETETLTTELATRLRGVRNTDLPSASNDGLPSLEPGSDLEIYLNEFRGRVNCQIWELQRLCAELVLPMPDGVEAPGVGT